MPEMLRLVRDIERLERLATLTCGNPSIRGISAVPQN